jgi:3-oxoadipate enol-lactonase
MPFVELRDARIFYEVTGEGRPLVLLHGAWASCQWWKWQAPALSERYRVFAVDVRGHGRSTPLEKVYSVPGFSADLEAFCQSVTLDRAVVVGWSMGGLIAIQHCLDHPSRVRALVLIGTRGQRCPSMKLRILQDYVQSLLDLMMTFAAPRKFERTGSAATVGHRTWIEREARRMLARDAPPEVIEWVTNELAAVPAKAYFEVARSIWNWDAEDRLREIDAPTLIIVGENDVATPPHFSQVLHEEIPDSKLVVVRGASHYVAMEQSALVNSEIVRFLEEVGYG